MKTLAKHYSTQSTKSALTKYKHVRNDYFHVPLQRVQTIIGRQNEKWDLLLKDITSEIYCRIALVKSLTVVES